MLKSQLHLEGQIKGLELANQVLTVLNSMPNLKDATLISVPSVFVSGIELGRDIVRAWRKREFKKIPLILLKTAEFANSAAELTPHGSLFPPIIALTIKGVNFSVGLIVSAREKAELSGTVNMLETMAVAATFAEFKEKWGKIACTAG